MPGIHSMKYVLASALLLGLASCTAQEPLQKAGSDNAIVEQDTSACRVSARQEAARQYPYGATVAGAATGMMLFSDDNNRATAEAAAFSSCLQNKGYSLPAK